MLEIGLELMPGHRLRNHRGSGGCGEVWEAELPDGSLVALKFLNCRNQPSTLVSSEIRVLLKLRQLRHPNIIRLLDVCASQQYIVLKMELADGNLYELLEVYVQETGHLLSADYLLDLMGQAAEALDFLAEQPAPGLALAAGGMQHCDVKPSNLLVTGEGLKIADFGLCMSSISQTYHGRFAGTPPYAAPELYEGRVTAQTDQYALAVTYCELATGGRALVPSDRGPLFGLPPVDLKTLPAKEVPIITRALEPNWMDRWPSCKAFVDALREVTPRTRIPSKKRGSRQPTTAA